MTETNFKILLPSLLYTHRLGIQIGHTAPPRLTVTLSGPLGSGKTCLVRGIAEGLGIKENINSPTFTLINEYHSGISLLYHVDLYRLSTTAPDAPDVEVLISQLDEIFERQAVVAIEWAELLQNYLPPDCLQISLSYVKDDTARKAEITGPGAAEIAGKIKRELTQSKK